MNRFLFSASLLLGPVLLQRSAFAQPAAPDAKPKTPTFSVAELEQFIGGRTLLSLDLKDATLEQVAAALSAASGQKIDPRAAPPQMSYSFDNKPPIALPAPLYGFSASKTAFWPALRGWQLAARRASQNAPAVAPSAVKTFMISTSFGDAVVPNSLGLSKNGAGWWLHPDNNLADGRAVEAWPFLLIANDLKRNQDGSLSEDGMKNVPSASLSGLAALLNPAVTLPTATKTADTEHWSDRLTLSGKVLIDPKLNPLALRCEVLEATDDKGNDLHLAGELALRLLTAAPLRVMTTPHLKLPAGSGNAANGRPDFQALLNSSAPATGYSQTLQIPLRSKPEMGKKLVRLRGVMRFSVVTRSQHWETTQLDKTIDGTIFGDGGEFKVQFKGLEKTGDGWSAAFAAQSRGGHLIRIWQQRLTAMTRLEERSREQFGSPAPLNLGRISGMTISSFGSDLMGLQNTLDFAGVPNMSLVDENGNVFEMSDNGSISTMTHQVPGGAPVVVAPGLSPLPPDLAQNWTYDESHNVDFTAPSGAIGAGAAMGRPVKLVLDLPLERREIEVPFEFTNLPLPPS